MSDPIPLRDALSALRAEIISATEAASTQAIRFDLGPIEMEFEVVATREKEGSGKIGFHLLGAELSLGGGAKATAASTQKVKIVLTPTLVDLTGKRTKVEISRQSGESAKPRRR